MNSVKSLSTDKYFLSLLVCAAIFLWAPQQLWQGFVP